MANYSPEQIDLLARMRDIVPLRDLQVISGNAAEDLVAVIRRLADDRFSLARNLLDQWDFWVRYEAALADGRHDRAEAVSMMIYDIDKAMGKPEDWSDPVPTSLATLVREIAA